MLDRYGNSQDNLRFLRSLPKSWEQDNWKDDLSPAKGLVIGLALGGMIWAVALLLYLWVR